MMRYEFKNNSPFKESVLLDLLTIFISKCIPYFDKETFSNTRESLDYINFRIMLEENYKQLHLVNDYSKLVTPQIQFKHNTALDFKQMMLEKHCYKME